MQSLSERYFNWLPAGSPNPKRRLVLRSFGSLLLPKKGVSLFNVSHSGIPNTPWNQTKQVDWRMVTIMIIVIHIFIIHFLGCLLVCRYLCRWPLNRLILANPTTLLERGISSVVCRATLLSLHGSVHLCPAFWTMP